MLQFDLFIFKSSLMFLFNASVACAGAIPPDLGKLSALQSLDFSHNQLDGEFMRGFGILKKSSLLACSYAVRNNRFLDKKYNERHLMFVVCILYPPTAFSGHVFCLLLLTRCTVHVVIFPSVSTRSSRLDLPPFLFPGLGDAHDALQLVSKFNSGENKYLNLRGNPWKMPPEAVVEQGLGAIRTYLDDVQNAMENGGQVRSLQLLKVVLVGSPSAGKTR